LRDDQPAVLGDGAADGVAGLDDALVDAAGQQVDLGEPAVAPEHIGEAAVPREGDVGVGEVAEAGDGGEAAVGAVLDDLHAAGGAFDDHAQVAGAAQGLGRGGGAAGEGEGRYKAGDGGAQAHVSRAPGNPA
jgi:hypothetical protein